MDNKDIQVLQKLVHYIDSISSYCADCRSLDDFQQNPMRVEACVFNLMQIGELSKTALSDSAKAQLSAIPWKQIYGLRNRIVHGYDGVDMCIVWDTIHGDLPSLQTELQQYL